jgi:hypothetical protein
MSKDLIERSPEEQWLEAEGFDLGALCSNAPPQTEVEAGDNPNINPASYDRVIIAFSGGKDSLALLLLMLDMGVPRERIELHHHAVDGREGSTLMDWPVTEGYCEAIAKAFGGKAALSARCCATVTQLVRCTSPMAMATDVSVEMDLQAFA